MEHDVSEGRQQFNMSRWEEYSRESQIELLTRIGSEARSGEMPLKQYLFLHASAKLSGTEQQMIYEWARAEPKRVRSAITETK